jgi:hypothetical protein
MSSSVLSPTFIIGSIRIGSVDGASCVNFGNNWPSDFTSISNTQQGFGSVSGDGNQLSHFHALLESMAEQEKSQEASNGNEAEKMKQKAGSNSKSPG